MAGSDSRRLPRPHVFPIQALRMVMNGTLEIQKSSTDSLIKRLIAVAEREDVLFEKLAQAVVADDQAAIVEAAGKLVGIRTGHLENCADLPR